MKVLESRMPILILSYQNCELYCCHLDGYKANTVALYERLKEIESILTSKPFHSKFRIWFNLDDNILTKSTMKAIAESIRLFDKHIYKIVFIGLRGIARWKFDHILKQTFGNKTITKAYFSDAELAKGWLL
ncbi:hypothetical protein [Lachnoclostridium phytofermentans]|uniref:STAS/SEC14 domain-containing protein n=1 Tax=Lachnoclostridium phytofermentans (strain ATCC 700394 / DSM 18823 / ISDg) TaxID=357809 RepID=A9KMD4_LACP7|nr:hypothetical protein [Lachnoclostridium phytofermentans]ABX42888.1 hypothetical protein Cphy_2527 [Lachnoclostridium phytofermentans ISDg]